MERASSISLQEDRWQTSAIPTNTVDQAVIDGRSKCVYRALRGVPFLLSEVNELHRKFYRIKELSPRTKCPYFNTSSLRQHQYKRRLAESHRRRNRLHRRPLGASFPFPMPQRHCFGVIVFLRGCLPTSRLLWWGIVPKELHG